MTEVHGADLFVGVGWVEDVVDISFSSSRPQWYVAFCSISMIDPVNNFDRDDNVAIDIAFFDGDQNNRIPWVSGGDNWGSPGAFSNYHVPMWKRFGTGVRFRLRSFDTSCAAAGWGLLWSLS